MVSAIFSPTDNTTNRHTRHAYYNTVLKCPSTSIRLCYLHYLCTVKNILCVLQFNVRAVIVILSAPENPEDGKMYFLVPAHLGCPGQSPESCKMVACVAFRILQMLVQIIQYLMVICHLLVSLLKDMNQRQCPTRICGSGFEVLIWTVLLTFTQMTGVKSNGKSWSLFPAVMLVFVNNNKIRMQVTAERRTLRVGRLANPRSSGKGWFVL